MPTSRFELRTERLGAALVFGLGVRRGREETLVAYTNQNGPVDRLHGATACLMVLVLFRSAQQ